MARTWHTDLRDLFEGDAHPTPLALRRRARFTQAIVEAATARGPDDARATAVRCIGEIDRRACGDWIHVVCDRDTIAWSCPGCADNGFVTHFAGSVHDLSRHAPPPDCARRAWALDEAQHKLLTSESGDVRAVAGVLARATPDTRDGEGALVIAATDDELGELYAWVRALMDLEPGGPRDEAFEVALASLAAALG